jgi:hypothetical protein
MQRCASAVARGALGLTAVGAAVVLGVGARSAWAVSEPALVGQWRFDELDGQEAVDDGPHRLDGRLGGTDASEADDPARIEGASGWALRFTGATLVRLPDSDALAPQALTAEAVVRASASPGPWRYVLSRGSQGCTAGAYGLYTGAASGLAFYVFDGTHYIVSATARPDDVWDGAWHHVAGSFDGRALRLFVDGRPVGAPIDAPVRIDYSATSTHAAIGQYTGACQLSFRGDIDMVRLWSGARSAAAVAGAAGESGAATGQAGVLPAAAPGTVLTSATSAAPRARACRLRLVSVTRTRRTVVRVRATFGTRPLRGARLIARPAKHPKVLASAKTDTKGRARLVLSATHRPRVRISARHRRGCAPLEVRWRRG